MEAISKLKLNRAADELGLAAELLKHAPPIYRTTLLQLFNQVLVTGLAPTSWRKTFFTMLPKTSTAKNVTDYRPIASTRLLYKLFAYLLLGRLEHTLEKHQPEEQHAFRADHRIEEHLLTAGLMLDKTKTQNVPLWVVSLDLSKAFDRVS